MLQVVADILRRRHLNGWLVGGSVRDLELGRFSPDLDIVVDGDPKDIARLVARKMQAPWFVLSERFPACRVMGPGGHVDVAATRGGGIVADLGERDFTVNAMAIPVEAATAAYEAGAIDRATLIDPFQGLTHLREGRLVAVSGRIFTADPLRLLRAVRFCHVLGLRPDARLINSIRVQAPLLSGTAAERVSTEICLTLAAGRSSEAVDTWRDLGLLAVVLPEIGQPRVEAALALLGPLDDLLRRVDLWFPAAAGLTERLARPVDGALSRPVALRLAALLHGIPAAAVEKVGRRLKLSGDALSLLSTVCRCMAETTVPGWPAVPASGAPGREAVLFLWDSAPWEPEVVLLKAAASAGVLAGNGRPWSAQGADAPLEPARRLLWLWAGRSKEGTGLPVDGSNLMRELGLPPGPKLGIVLREVRLAWEAGEIASTEEVLGVARTFIDSCA